jgi:tetratricopeptide (TPR) repeat protein
VTRRLWPLLAVLGILTAAGPVLAQPATRVLVMPFENVAREGRIVWLSEASAVLLADDLNALGVRAITREERNAAFSRLKVPPATTLTDATVIRIGHLVGASEVVVGTLRLDGDRLVVQARSIALEAGRIQSTATEQGPVPDLFSTFGRLARRLVPASGHSPGNGERDRPPVAAFENYIKGLVAETPATAVGYLTAALQAYPALVRARLALWDVYAEQGDHERALAAVQGVSPESPRARRAQFLQGLSQLQLRRHDEAFATFKALASAQPSATVLNNLGVVQLRRGATPQTGQATYYFNQATEADPSGADYFFNLGYAYWLERDFQAAIYWLREALRRAPADADAHFVLAGALAAAGQTSESAREQELARRLSSNYEGMAKQAGPPAVPRGLERVKTGVELPPTSGLEEVLAASGRRDQQDLVRFYLDRARRLFEEEKDREAFSEVNRVLFLSPYFAEAHVLAARIHLRAGRFTEATDALKISLWSNDTAEARGVLARAQLEAGQPEAARAEARRALAIDPASLDALAVLEDLDGASAPPSRR